MGILTLLMPILGKLLDKVLPDPQAAADAKLKLLELTQQGALAELDSQTKQQLAASGVVEAEANSKHWLAADWRPIFMLVLVALIVAHFFGWTAKGVSQQEYLEVWDVVKIGLGGYVFTHPASLNAVGNVVKSLKGN